MTREGAEGRRVTLAVEDREFAAVAALPTGMTTASQICPVAAMPSCPVAANAFTWCDCDPWWRRAGSRFHVMSGGRQIDLE
jgi:hypothetical protein